MPRWSGVLPVVLPVGVAGVEGEEVEEEQEEERGRLDARGESGKQDRDVDEREDDCGPEAGDAEVRGECV
ncbi:hypothetical protein C484_11296 [Natrialba taiwanensis DSM 12281]|uniref:Uncharacterized protein n=1 Tax=Natrialba taiwanensis DSM 12281 TaxID=1230458 RepID=L9ZWD7_9EURY|nr:hypothetical protein C484_11296 [Natrialba taiwanensis DSM 12281]